MENQTKIMVVDDELGICMNVEKILAKSNYSVVHTQSAHEALEMMKKDSFSLLISDIVMPEMNGLELLKHVAREVPDTKTVMMTGYASTNTAVKAIRFGALDYIPKPFTPDELRTIVDKALSGELVALDISREERESMEAKNIDMGYGSDKVADLIKPGVETILDEAIEKSEHYCDIGKSVCPVMKKLGTICKIGSKKNYCPKILAKEKRQAREAAMFNPETMIGIDQPFDYNEVVAVTGPEYVHHLDRDGFAFLPYEELKKVKPVRVEADKAEVPDLADKSLLKNILVVDDEVSVNNNIRKILEKSGFQVDQAITKDEAIERINEQSYKLVLLDLRMPGVSGLDLLKTISKTQPSARVIIITGYASIETAVQTARIGVVDYLPKPFTPFELREVTEKAYAIAA